MYDDGLFFRKVAELSSFNCLKFLFANERKEKFVRTLISVYVNNHLECFKFLFENGLKI